MGFWFCFLITIPSYTLLRWLVSFPIFFLISLLCLHKSVIFFPLILYKMLKIHCWIFKNELWEIYTEKLVEKAEGIWNRLVFTVSSQFSDLSGIYIIEFYRIEIGFSSLKNSQCIPMTVPSFVPSNATSYLDSLFLCVHQNCPQAYLCVWIFFFFL